MLTARSRRVTSQHLERDHEPDVCSAGSSCPRIHHASHGAAAVKRPFLVHKCDATHARANSALREHPCDLDQGGDAARVVIGSGAPSHRIVVRAEHEGLTCVVRALTLDLQVRSRDAPRLVNLTVYPIAGLPQHPLDVIRRCVEGLRTPEMPLPDLLRERDDMAA